VGWASRPIRAPLLIDALSPKRCSLNRWQSPRVCKAQTGVRLLHSETDKPKPSVLVNGSDTVLVEFICQRKYLRRVRECP
jgi:hypothetical protein